MVVDEVGQPSVERDLLPGDPEAVQIRLESETVRAEVLRGRRVRSERGAQEALSM